MPIKAAAPSSAWSTGLLLLACAGLGGLVALELNGTMPLAPQVTAAAPPPAALDAPEPIEFELPARARFDDITTRPLFSPSRRPYVPPPPEPAAGPETTPTEATVDAASFVLVGVLVTDRRRSALVQAAETEAPVWVREGQKLEGWWIDAISSAHVRLRRGEREVQIELRADLSNPVAAQIVRPRARDRAQNRDGVNPDGGNRDAENAEQSRPPDEDG